jgi:cold shock CspA family protein
MRTHGTLSKWNEDRGFGFISPASGDDVFAHISAFPRDGVRPSIGEVVSFEIETRGDGRKRALRIQRPARTTTARGVRESRAPATPIATALGALAVVAIGALFYFDGELVLPHRGRARASHAVETQPDGSAGARRKFAATTDGLPETATSASRFSCDGRTLCREMHSCAEATYFLQNCPNVQMDGDGDGVPCERQWCRQ